jgi:hypothetical protein
VADTDSMLRYDVELVDPLGPEATGEGDLSFAVFSLAHAECGDHVLEVRIGEHMLLEWCTGCAVMEVFGSCERWGDAITSRTPAFQHAQASPSLVGILACQLVVFI